MTEIRTRLGAVKTSPPSDPMLVLLLFSVAGSLVSLVALLFDRNFFDLALAFLLW